MLNFRTNSEQIFTDASATGLLSFGLKPVPSDKTFFFSFESLGGTSIASFFAVKINANNKIYSATELDVNLITSLAGSFYCLSEQNYTLENDCIYYFQIIDNDGNVYNSEPFSTFETIAENEVRNVTGSGSLAVQTTELFSTDKSLLYFGLKQFSRYEIPYFSFNAIQNDTAIVSIQALKVDSNKNIVATIDLSATGITISNGIITVPNLECELDGSAIYCLLIVSNVATYYSEFFNTISEKQITNIVVTFDTTKSALYNTFTTFDGESNDYFDFSQT